MEFKMEMTNTKGKDTIIDCPSIDIAMYIDGELTPNAEIELDRHLGMCAICTDELNIQKQLINALDGSLKSVPELPKDFARHVITTAESSVGGLRKSSERTSAMYVSAALFFIVLFTLGASAPGAFSAIFDVLVRSLAVLSFVAHIIYDIGEGITILVRTFLSQPKLSTPLAVTAVIVLAISGFYFYQTLVHSRSSRIESGKIS
jgi:hypothetical protein